MSQAWHLLSVALFGLLFFSTQTAAERRVVFSLNATTVTIGSTVTLTCNLTEYSDLSGVFFVNFFRDNPTNFGGYFAAFEASTTFGTPLTTRFNPQRPLIGATYQQLSSTYPLYQISLTPTDTPTHTYYCHLHKDPKELDVELKTATVAPWSNIHHGQEMAFPSFQIWVTGTPSMKGSWWCRLVQGTPGSAEYREFSSNKESL